MYMVAAVGGLGDAAPRVLCLKDGNDILWAILASIS